MLAALWTPYYLVDYDKKRKKKGVRCITLFSTPKIYRVEIYTVLGVRRHFIQVLEHGTRPTVWNPYWKESYRLWLDSGYGSTHRPV